MSVVALLALNLVWLSGCSSQKLCDEARVQLDQGRLQEASDAYARAEAADEGSCASEGLEKVAERRAQALVHVSRARAAEGAGDRKRAAAEYQSALTDDRGNGDALAGLSRVTSRPTTLDKVWLKAQRLYDEGYVTEARAEVVRVLRANPELVVPESLVPLTQSPSPTPAAPPEPMGEQATVGNVSWVLVAVMGAALLLAIAAGAVFVVRSRRDLSQAWERISGLQDQIKADREAGKRLAKAQARADDGMADLQTSTEERAATLDLRLGMLDGAVAKVAGRADADRSDLRSLAQAVVDAGAERTARVVRRFRVRDEAAAHADPSTSGDAWTTVCVTLAREVGTGGAEGRIWVIRSIEPGRPSAGAAEPGRPMLEGWATHEPVSGLTLLTGDWITAAAWCDLIAGRPISSIDGPVPLLAAGREATEAVLDRLSGEPTSEEPDGSAPVESTPGAAVADGPEVLIELRSDVEVTGGRARPRSVASEQTPGDPLTAAASRSLGPALDEHGLVEVSAGPKGEPQAVVTQLRLKDVTGGQIGDHNHQFNRVVVEAPGRKLDFENVLKRSDVASAVQRLQADRSSPQRRQDLVDSLRDVGAWGASTQITVKPRGSGFGAFLRRAFFFDARNVQVGDHNTQHNDYTYIASKVPSDVQLLAKDPQLAKDLADYLCPRPGQERDAQALRDRIEEALQRPGVKFEGAEVGTQFDGASLGKVLEIKRTDGFTVGVDNRQVTDVDVKVVDLAPTVRPRDLNPRRMSDNEVEYWLSRGRDKPDRASVRLDDLGLRPPEPRPPEIGGAPGIGMW